jgi:hypothetical protein
MDRRSRRLRRGALGEDEAVPRLTRGLGPISIALTAWDIWRRLPPQQRRQLINLARRHGPKVAAYVMAARARAREKRR